jgi:hypothetical protein
VALPLVGPPVRLLRLRGGWRGHCRPASCLVLLVSGEMAPSVQVATRSVGRKMRADQFEVWLRATAADRNHRGEFVSTLHRSVRCASWAITPVRAPGARDHVGCNHRSPEQRRCRRNVTRGSTGRNVDLRFEYRQA